MPYCHWCNVITEFQCNVNLRLTPTDLQPTLVGEKTNEVGLMSDLARVHIYIICISLATWL